MIRIDAIILEAFYTEKEAAPLLGKSVAWLQKHRCYGTGPAYFKNGKPIHYRGSDLVAWLESGRVEPKNEP